MLKYTKAPILRATVSQNTMRNERLLDLWRSHCCASTAPGQPHSNPSSSKVRSEVRQRPCLAADLSIA